MQITDFLSTSIGRFAVWLYSPLHAVWN